MSAIFHSFSYKVQYIVMKWKPLKWKQSLKWKLFKSTFKLQILLGSLYQVNLSFFRYIFILTFLFYIVGFQSTLMFLIYIGTLHDCIPILL